MKVVQTPIKTIISSAVLAVMAHQAVHAGAFSLYTEGSAAAIGNFAAGIAAEAADASIGWYNPAGLVLIKEQQVVFSGVGVFPSSKLTGTSLYQTPSIFDSTQTFEYAQSFHGLQGGKGAVVPALHYALPLGERVAFGLSIVAPFGLSTQYSDTSAVRYAATLSQLETVNVSPELGGKLTDHLAIGAGLDLQYARVKFNSVLGSPAAMQAADLPAAILDSQSYNTGDSFAVGFHAGTMLLWNANHTRFGLNYQSEVSHEFKGYSRLTGLLAQQGLNVQDLPYSVLNPASRLYSNNLYSNEIHLPAIVTLSGYQDVNAHWAVMGSLVYSAWSSFNTIRLNNIAVGIANIDGVLSGGTANTTITENYRDVWRVAVGANYRVNEQWMIRMGGGYDQTPTVNTERDVRLPDPDRWALSLGTHYQFRPNLGFDLGYTYLFAIAKPGVNKISAVGRSTYTVNALADVHAQLFGLQVVWTMDAVKPAEK